MEPASQLLHALGLRATPQRLLLVEVARLQRGHFTAEEVHREILGRPTRR